MPEAIAWTPVAAGRPVHPTDDDWLILPEAELEAMQAEALALFMDAGSAAPAGRAVAGFAVLHQVMIARAVVRATGLPADEARAAMRCDHALGYFFGPASGGNGAAVARRPERRVAATLMLLHDLVFGRAAAEQLTAELLDRGTTAVGEAFADGMLAAAADLAGLRRWRHGTGGSLPGGLLDGLPLPCWARERAGDHRL